jgi:hypothetical protein
MLAGPSELPLMVAQSASDHEFGTVTILLCKRTPVVKMNIIQYIPFSQSRLQQGAQTS